MSTSDEIHAAIAAHGAWKDEFTQAIQKGKFDAIAPRVKSDHRCDFGSWLFGKTVPAKERKGRHFTKVRKLHAEIHRLAEEILKKAKAGKRAEALKLLEDDKALEVYSTSLQLAALEWERNWGKPTPPRPTPAIKAKSPSHTRVHPKK
jgi:hypothetical protein